MATRTRRPSKYRACARPLALLLACAAVSACAPTAKRALPVASPGAPSPPGHAADAAARLEFDDHLGFGLRLEALSVRVDGRPAYWRAGGARAEVPRDLGAMDLTRGVHVVSVVARVSMACGLLGDPRTAVVVRASSAFRTTAGSPATITMDLFARAITKAPADLPVVQFHGRGVELGVAAPRDLADPVHPACVSLDPVAAAACDVEASAAEARASGDAVAVACSTQGLEQIRRMRAVIDDATSTMGEDTTTNDAAMHAQLRARWAEAEIKRLAAHARQCNGDDELAGAANQPACPPDGVTASK